MLITTKKPSGERFVAQFVSRVYQQPDAVALVCEDQSYSYQALGNRVATLVSVLSDKIGQANAVVLLMPRGVDFVAAMIACQYLAIPYIPLDINTKAVRLQQIMDSADYVLLSDVANGFNAIDLSQVPKSTVELSNVEHLQANSDVHTEAYRIYTSGSTGEPKAVMVAESGCRNLLSHFGRQLSASNQTNWLSSTSVAFDIFYLEYALPLAFGGKLILMSDRQMQSPQEVANQLVQHCPDIYQATPSMYKCLLPYLPASWTFDKALVGGEKLGVQLSTQLHQRSTWLCNVYGPTETTVWSTTHVIEQPGDNRIGQPIDNTDIYVLDEQMQSVVQGQQGKIYIGGKGLAFGYFKNEALSESKFVWATLNGLPQRIYDTGDIGLIDQDSHLVYLHREGDFHKINGYRVDTNEIVDALEKIDAVAQAAVIVVEQNEQSRVIAYARAADGELDLSLLRAELERQLATYMQPHQLLQVDKFDYTTSGKLDSKALHAALAQTAFVPSSNNDNPIYEILAQYIDTTALTENENLFHRGLTSMQAISFHMDLTEHFPDLELYHIFDEPTIDGITNTQLT